MKFALIHNSTGTVAEQHIAFARTLAEQTNREFLLMPEEEDAELEDWCEANSVDMLFISCRNSRHEVQHWLNRCRNLRLPYVFLTDTMLHLRPLGTILAPVSMLEEEVHKAETLTHLMRYTQAKTVLLHAHDYGSRAQQNVNRIQTSLRQFGFEAEVEEAKKDSFSLNREACLRQNEWQTDMLVITASRDYGLDDLFFGPQERHVIRRSACPVLLLNPRGDLFSLCD